MRFNTLLLDQNAWDLVIDSSGNIAMAAPPYALAQDVACAIKTQKGEMIYDTTQGIPYLEGVLGYPLTANVLQTFMQDAALTVPGVVTASANLTLNRETRNVNGIVAFVDETGQSNVVQL